MIGVLYSYDDRNAGELVVAALQRSVSETLVARISINEISRNNCILAINPDEGYGQALISWLASGRRKLILFGSLPECLCTHFNLRNTVWPEKAELWSRSLPAESGYYSESKGNIKYSELASQLGANNWFRPLERFDFADEWNNLGYGAIRVDDSIWSIAAPLRASEGSEVAAISFEEQTFATYVALFNSHISSTFWVNRPVGFIDSFEWYLLEAFISEWRHLDMLPCLPVISEIPYGYDAAITMRLDCDEDIFSAQPLWNAYKNLGVPLSLALHTSNLPNPVHEDFLKSFINDGGVLLSHTATHAPNWGGSYDAAYHEAIESRCKIESSTGIRVNYAVSPFHQSPPYALAALCDAGYSGCIGGIIRNDPEFLIARGGKLANLPDGFIGHSQQTMLHGDCMLADGDPLKVFKQAFNQALETRTLFGFLDHPFSSRYQYGWVDEQRRIDAHQALIGHIRATARQPLFMDECQAMDFLRDRAAIRLHLCEKAFAVSVPFENASYEYAVQFRGELVKLNDGMVLV
ncbi:MAG: polysaccharide deacetylase [Dickeya sp.]|nr:hypothetical protein DFO54_104273 [Erwinia sp. AG740]